MLFFPVDSATSCSIHSPMPTMEDFGDRIPILSRRGRVPAIAAPRTRPGFDSSSARRAARVASASSSRVSISTPASPQGTSPNAARAEYRPPTCGSALNTRYPSSRAAMSNGEPGSVTTTIRVNGSIPAAVNAASNARLCESVSTVDPDFDDTTTTVVSMSVSTTRASCVGCVVSSTTRGTPSVRVITSGASEEPPMPHSTIRFSPRARNSSCNAVISGISGRECSLA